MRNWIHISRRIAILSNFDRIEVLSSNIAYATTIKEPLKYEGLTLNPDGTLAFYLKTHVESDTFRWDSSFSLLENENIMEISQL